MQEIPGEPRSFLRIKCLSKKLEAKGRHALGCSTQVNSDAREQNPLEINVILLSDGLNEVLFASIDVMYVGPEVRLHFEKVFSERLGPHQIVVGASHTHNAPNLDSTKPLLSSVSIGFLNEVKLAVIDISKSLEESRWKRVSITNENFPFDMGVSRRKQPNKLLKALGLVSPDFLQLPNWGKSSDEKGSFLNFWDGREVVASLCIIPCHPVSYPEQTTISPDFPGYLRSKFRKHGLVTKASTPAFVFYQGASGDLRPPALSKSHRRSWRQTSFRLIYGRSFGRFTTNAYEAWCDKIWTLLAEAIENSGESSVKALTQISCFRVAEPMTVLAIGAASVGRLFSLQLVEFGSFSFLAISSEVTRRMGKRILSESGLSPLPILLTCTDDTFGYVVDPSELDEGGYEVSGWTESFGIPNSYKAEFASETVLKLVRRLVIRS